MTYASINGSLTPVQNAVVPVSDINFTYGYGVYETLKLRKRQIYFIELHAERLLHSAAILNIEHDFTAECIRNTIISLVIANKVENSNIKVLLIGGADSKSANLYIMQLNPLFPERKLYKQGCRLISYKGERHFPKAKSLSMLLSSIAYHQAIQNNAYDALLIDRYNTITEGTRTNFFAIKNDTVISPPEDKILSGVTRLTLMECLKQNGIHFTEEDLKLENSDTWDACFITSTSTKVMPVTHINNQEFKIPELLLHIKQIYDAFLKDEYEKHAPLW